MPIDMSGAVSPPRKTTKPRATGRPIAPPVSDTQRRTESLTDLSQIGIGVLLIFGKFADAGAVAQHFPPFAQQLAIFAETNAPTASVVDLTSKVTPYLAMATTAMPLVLQIMANHNMIDPVKMRMLGQNVLPPEVLEAQMAVEVTRLQAEAEKAKAKAMADIAELRASVNGSEAAHAA